MIETKKSWLSFILPCCCNSKKDSGAIVYARDLNGKFEYRTHDHCTVLFSKKGSVWQRVLPYCLFNTFVTAIIVFGRTLKEDYFDFTIPDNGHKFMSMLASFLVVTRCKIAYQRYCETSSTLSNLMRSSRELVQQSVAFTRYENLQQARKWRFEIARQVIVILSTIVHMLQFEANREKVYFNHALMDGEEQALSIALGDPNERTPNVLVIFLRSTISSHIKCLEKPLSPNEELTLLSSVADFIRSYNALMKITITPFPFPLVQMTRTILFIWIFTLPFGLDHDMTSIFPPCFIIFFITFGFLGLEFLSIEMDDPFGNDDTDFDVLSMAKVVFDDININIHDIDGPRAKFRLHKMTAGKLTDGIQREMRGHARSFSKIGAWTDSLDKKDEKVTSGLAPHVEKEDSHPKLLDVVLQKKISMIEESV